jgi:hypothetical protein
MEAKEFWDKLSTTLDLPFLIEDVTGIEENAGSTHIDTNKGTFFITVEKCESTKKFLWVDKSGGGRKSSLELEDLLEMNDKENSDHISYDGVTVAEWAVDAEEGDDWQNAANRYICVES